MAIERHVKLCSSVRAKQNFHKTKRCIVVSIWLYALLMSFPPIVGWGNYVKDAYCASCTFDFYSRNLNAKSYLIFLLAFGFLLPCFIIIACYVSIFRRIRESRNAVKKMLLMKETEIILKSDETQNLMGSRAICSVCDINKARNSHLASERDTTKTETVYTVIQRLAKEEVKFAKLTLAVIVGFLICWTPYALLAIAYQFDSMTLHTTVTSAVTLIMAKSSVAINPIIYSFREKQFRKDLVQLISGPVNESSSS